MIPRLEAGEMLGAIRAAQLAQPVSGNDEFALERALEERQAMIARIEARAEGRVIEDAPAASDPASAADLAMIGIAVVRDTPSSSNQAGDQDHG